MGAATVLPILQANSEAGSAPSFWRPKRVLVTKSAREWPQATALAERAAALGADVQLLTSDRLPRIEAATPGRAYAEAKSTLAVVVAPPSRRKLQPIPPSADWQFHLAEGCPAHCQYCYLAGSLKGAPITRVFANLAEILRELPQYLGKGSVTSRSQKRSAEGTTFECSCYTDPLGIEHLTGSLAETIKYFGAWDEQVQLRWTTKFANVEPLLNLAHNGKTRVRFSVNADAVAKSFEGGTPPISNRLQAMQKMAHAGYPTGLTIAPTMPLGEWETDYAELLHDVAAALASVENLDLTVELITHRFTAGSKRILLGWYPKTPLEMDENQRTAKRTKFGSVKYIYEKDLMKQMRGFFETEIARVLPQARILYWT